MEFELDVERMLDLIACMLVIILYMVMVMYLRDEDRKDNKVYWFAYCEGEKRQFINKIRVTKYQYDHYKLFEPNYPVRDITSNTIWFIIRDNWL